MEEALGARVQGMGEGVWGGCRQVPEEDCGPDGEEQLSAVLGQSKVLRDRGGDGESVSVAERGDTAGIRSAADTGWDSNN